MSDADVTPPVWVARGYELGPGGGVRECEVYCGEYPEAAEADDTAETLVCWW